PVPTNSTPSCSASGGAGSGGLVCSFTCDDGFVENSGGCVPMSSGAGGAGGKTGTGGRTSSTGGTTSSSCRVDNDCTVSCGMAGPLPCCMLNHVCGCTFFQVQVG